MKLDNKKKKIQLKYREKLQQRNDDKKYHKEVIIISIIIAFIFLLDYYVKGF